MSALGLRNRSTLQRLRGSGLATIQPAGAVTWTTSYRSSRRSSAVIIRAMPWAEVPDFLARLRETESIGTLALEFLILTAARSGEILRSVRDGEIMAARWEDSTSMPRCGRCLQTA